jgi:anti-anti-sigma factor
MSLDVREDDGIFVLTPHGKLLGGKETDELQDRIKELDGAGNEKLVMNLGKTTYMSSMGMAVLFRAHASYAKRGARVKICAVDKKIQQIFVLVKLTLVYGDDVHETLEEALASFRSTVGSVDAG